MDANDKKPPMPVPLRHWNSDYKMNPGDLPSHGLIKLELLYRFKILLDFQTYCRKYLLVIGETNDRFWPFADIQQLDSGDDHVTKVERLLTTRHSNELFESGSRPLLKNQSLRKSIHHSIKYLYGFRI